MNVDESQHIEVKGSRWSTGADGEAAGQVSYSSS